MQDDELRDLFHRVELRLERIDAKLDAQDKRLTMVEGRLNSLESRIDGRLAGIDNRIDNKASNITVSLWGATLAMLIGAAFALTKWL
jgi:hypothetical protein